MFNTHSEKHLHAIKEVAQHQCSPFSHDVTYSSI